MKGSTSLLLLLAAFSTFAHAGPHAGIGQQAAKDKRVWTPVERLKDAPATSAATAFTLPAIEFPITVANPETQKLFNHGISALHALEYAEAERCFRAATVADPACAMAYWGMSMANLENPRRATALIKDALIRRASISPREQRWIDVYATLYIGTDLPDVRRRELHVQALEQFCYDFPEDSEARAFLLFHLWNNVERGRPAPSRFLVETLARQVLAHRPAHHGVQQYVLSLWTPEHGEAAARNAAGTIEKSRPKFSHAWYAAGRALERLGDYRKAEECYEAAMRLEHQRMVREGAMPFASHVYPELIRGRARNLAKAGWAKKAIEICRSTLALPRSRTGREPLADAAADTLLEILVENELWSELATLDPATFPTVEPRESIGRLRAIAAAAFRTGDATRGTTLLRQLQVARMKIRARRTEAADLAEEEARKRRQSPEDIAAAMAAAMRVHSEDVEAGENALAEVRLAQALAKGDSERARSEFANVRDLPLLHEARLRFEAGDRGTAVELARQAARLPEVSALMYARIADILWHGGEREEATAVFQKLRPLTAGTDFSLPVFARLAPIAADLKMRTPAQSKATAMEGFGPANWEPAPAASWQMLDLDSRPRTLEEFAGKPLIMLYYLGSGCVHCIEQLNAFAPLAKEFKEAGIEIVAVSTEPAEVLHKTWEQARQGGGFPFPILADPELKGFKAYRAFDEFKVEALHGTFLIDAAGKVRWQNTGVEPYADPRSLLEEARRLLPGKKVAER